MTSACRISFGAVAIATRNDSTPTLSVGGLFDIGDLNDLVNGTTVEKALATYEPDFWLLNGEYKFAAADPHGGYINDLQSGATGTFTTNPAIQIDFSEVHSTTDGLTLHFSPLTGDWCDDITIAYYNSGLSLIQSDNHTPTGVTFNTGQAVANFKRIIITFKGTNKNYRFARLARIDFDTLTIFTDANVKNATIIEQVDPSGLTLPANTIDFELYSDAGGFSVTNPSGVYADLQYKEPIEVHENVNGVVIYMGTFYLDDWDAKSENLATFMASDAIALLGSEPHYNPYYSVYGIDYSEDLIGHIMDTAGVPYEVDASLQGIDITDADTLRVMPCREALQQVLFLIGAYATASRSNKVHILPVELASEITTPDHTLTSAEKSLESPVKLRKLVTAVEVFSHQLSAYSIASENIFNDTLAVGDHTIVLDHFSFYGYSGTATRTITEHGADYVKLNVTGAGTFIITESYLYRDITQKAIVENGSLPANTPANVISVRDATLVPPGFLAAVTQQLYDYYLQQYIQVTKLFGYNITVGESVLIDSQSSKQISGHVERCEIDLTGGYIIKATIIGDIAA